MEKNLENKSKENKRISMDSVKILSKIITEEEDEKGFESKAKQYFADKSYLSRMISNQGTIGGYRI